MSRHGGYTTTVTFSLLVSRTDQEKGRQSGTVWIGFADPFAGGWLGEYLEREAVAN